MTDFYSKNVKSVEMPLVLAKKIITVFALTVILSLALVMTISSYYASKTPQETKKTSL